MPQCDCADVEPAVHQFPEDRAASHHQQEEEGEERVSAERLHQAEATEAGTLAVGCPFCMVMMTDGLKYANKDEEVKNYDIAELIAMALKL